MRLDKTRQAQKQKYKSAQDMNSRLNKKDKPRLNKTREDKMR